MRPLSPDQKAELQSHLQAVARILYHQTEPEKLKTFESIEVEVREQILQEVAPQIGEFFSLKGGQKRRGNSAKSKPV